mgnify:CR=1 FL=1
MNIEGENIMKLCSFYVSDWHLVTMLLPYINRKINEKEKIVTVLENDIKNNVETLVKRLNLRNEEEILNIDWSKRDNYLSINKLLNNNIEENIIIIVNGTKEYIKEANKNIDTIIEKNRDKINQKNIKIINCYEIVEFNGSIVEILDNHDKILNTSGEKEINEVFEDYTKSEKIS